MNLLATLTDQSITWGDLLVVLAVLALLAVVFGGIGRWRR